MRKIIVILVLFITYGSLISQCNLSGNFVIKDDNNSEADTTNLRLVVQNAVNNDLSSVNQGVCGVFIKFKHPFQKELFLELVSPSGQVITLVGGNVTAYNTPFTTWDVGFVGCSSSASPDLGFSDRWENDQDWVSFNTYKGNYYPNTGCLEDLNLGQVNGTWTLRCIDFVDFGEGVVQDFRIVFCSQTGIICDQCNLVPSRITNQDFSSCEKNDNLRISLLTEIDKNLIDTVNYTYTNIVFSNGQILYIGNTIDLRGSPPGNYQIYTLQFAKVLSNFMPRIGENFTPESYRSHLFSRGFCAALNDDPLNIYISPAIPALSLNKKICKGSSFMVGTEVFEKTGIYEIVIKKEFCDSIISLNLEVVDLMGAIQADRDSISCIKNSLAIQFISNNTSVSGETFQWFTNNGTIRTSTIDKIIDISSEGVYCLSYSAVQDGQTCIDTLCKEIYLDVSNPILSLSSDILTCARDSVTVMVASTIPISNASWISVESNPFVVVGTHIKVNKPGTYSVNVLAENGCTTSKSIEVKIDTTAIIPTFLVDTFRCMTDSLQVLSLIDSSESVSISWQNVTSNYENVLNPYVFNAEPILANITNLRNGCLKQAIVNIYDVRDKPSINGLEYDTITCSNPQTSVKILSPNIIASYKWEGLNFTSDLSSPIISKAGMYSVTITEELTGCQSDTTFIIEEDKIIAKTTLSANILSCVMDSTVIDVQSSLELVTAEWVGPGNFMSSEINPTVSEVGEYILRYTSHNGCVGFDTINILASIDLPIVDIKVPNITCPIDTVMAIVVDTRANLAYEWKENNVINPKSQNASFFQAGDYTVTITDTISMCSYTTKIKVIDDRSFSVLSINSPSLTCALDSVQIVVANPEVGSMTTTGPNGFISEVLNPFVKLPGKYYISATNLSLCTSMDSVIIIQNDIVPTISTESDTITCTMPQVNIIGKSDLTNTEFRWIKPDGSSQVGDTIMTSKPGQYMVWGTAPNGCSSQNIVNIEIDTLRPIVSLVQAIDSLTCKLKEVILNIVTDDFNTVSWSSFPIGQNPVIVNTAGNFVAQVTAPNGCMTTRTQKIYESKNIPKISTLASEINCKDLISTINVNSNGSSDLIRWRNTTNPSSIPDGSFTFSTSFDGKYDFVVINEEGCEKDSSIVIVANKAKPLILTTINDSITCLNPNAKIGVQIGTNVIEYKWNGPNINDLVADSIIMANEQGRYYVLITGDNFCKKDTFIDVIRNDQVPSITTFSDTLTCNKGKITIGVNPNPVVLDYKWQGPSFVSDVRTPIISEPGLYTVTVTAENDCSTSAVINVIQDIVKPTFMIKDTFLLPCDTSQISLDITQPNKVDRLKWIFPDNSVRNILNPNTTLIGQYSVQATGTNGCLGQNTEFFVIINDKKIEYRIVSDTITCSNLTANLDVLANTNIIKYQWIAPSMIIYNTKSISSSENGIFRIIVTNEAKCVDTTLVFIPIDTIRPLVNLTSEGEIKCDSKEVRLSANFLDTSSRFTYQWTTNDGVITGSGKNPSIDIMDPGTYDFELVDSQNGCINKQSLVIVKAPQDFNNVNIDTYSPPCINVFDGRFSLTNLDGKPPYRVQVNEVDYGQKLEFNNLKPDSYRLKIIDSLGCELDRVIELINSNDRDLIIDNEYIIDFGDSITLIPMYTKDSFSQNTLIWTSLNQVICNGCDSITVSPYENKLYTITNNISEKCTKIVSVLVRVRRNLKNAIPNVINLNSATGNDIFYIAQTRGIEKVEQLDIFDKWAENVYHIVDARPGDRAVGWNGTFDNKQVETGVYIVITQLMLTNGEYVKIVSDLTVLK